MLWSQTHIFQKAFLGDFSLLSNDFPGNVLLVS